MPRLWRNILFAIFALGFFISAPLVVLYTAGYRYQFGSMQIVKAGVLSVTTTPKGATVYINGIVTEKKTPAVIDNIFPGKVVVRIEKPGYSSWEKTLVVESGQSTFVPNATLFLDGTPAQAVNQTSVLFTTPKSATRFAYLVENGATLEAWIKDESIAQTKPLYTQPLRAKSTYTLSWSADAQFLLLTETAAKNTYTILRVSDGAVITLPATSVARAWWNTHSGHVLFYRVGSELRAFGIDADVAFPKNTSVDDAQIKQGDMLVVQSGEQSVVAHMNPEGVANIIAYLPRGTYTFVTSPAPYIALEDTSRNHLILIDPNQKNPLLLNEEVRFFEWSPNQDQLVFSNGFDINLFSPHSGERTTITRFSETITDLIWYPIGNELLYSKQNTLYSLELDRRDVRNEPVLASDVLIHTMWVSKNGETLFFFGQRGSEPATIFERRLQK